MENAKHSFKLGIALGGGAARGLAHVGVLKALEEHGIKPDMISGTSAGAVVGALYSYGISPQYMHDLISPMTRADWIKLVDIAFFKNGLMKGQRMMKWLKSFTHGDLDFRDLRIPFSAVAADINTGEKVVLAEGSVWDAVRASISVPVIFSVVEKDDRFLVDGGISETVPAATLRDMGADFIIAVNVMPLSKDRLLSPELITKEKKRDNRPGLLHVAMHTYEIADARIINQSLKHADFVIEPDTRGVGAAEFKKGPELMQNGYLAALSAIDALKEVLSSFDPAHKITKSKNTPISGACPPEASFGII